MKVLDAYRPFHESAALERALFGGFGSGKTYAGVDEAIAWCLEQPGIRGLASRKTIPELRDTLEPIFFQRLPEGLADHVEVRKTGGHTESVTFSNGSVLLFRSLDDAQKHRSLNLGFWFCDEANEIDADTYGFMRGRLRQRDLTAEALRLGHTGEIRRRGSWVITNPSGHDWLYKRFVDPMTRADGTEHWSVTSLQNPMLPPDYIDTLLSFPADWVRRYVLCSFDDFAGQVYKEWTGDPTAPDLASNVIPRHSIRPPAGAIHWMGMDPGTRNPTAGLWVWVDNERRRLVGVAEYAEGDRSVPEHCAAWRAIEGTGKMHVRWRVSDPGSLPNRDRGSNMSLQDQYRREGYNFVLGPKLPKDRVPMLGLLIAQKRFVVTDACPRTAQQIRDYKWEEITTAMKMAGKDAPEKPLKGDDDLVDCSQYLASRWVKPTAIRPRVSDRSEWEAFSDQTWGKVRRRKNAQARRRVTLEGAAFQ